MSWKNGSELMSEVIRALIDNVPDDGTRKQIYDHIIPVFENQDCDTLYECVDEDQAFKESLKEVGFNYEEEDYEEESEEYLQDE